MLGSRVLQTDRYIGCFLIFGFCFRFLLLTMDMVCKYEAGKGRVEFYLRLKLETLDGAALQFIYNFISCKLLLLLFPVRKRRKNVYSTYSEEQTKNIKIIYSVNMKGQNQNITLTLYSQDGFCHQVSLWNVASHSPRSDARCCLALWSSSDLSSCPVYNAQWEGLVGFRGQILSGPSYGSKEYVVRMLS